MITVHDVEGTVTLSLEDYEKLRDREDIAITENLNRAETLNKLREEFTEDKEKFSEGLIRQYVRVFDNWGKSAEDVTWVSEGDAIVKLQNIHSDEIAKLKNEQAHSTEIYRKDIKAINERNKENSRLAEDVYNRMRENKDEFYKDQMQRLREMSVFQFMNWKHNN